MTSPPTTHPPRRDTMRRIPSVGASGSGILWSSIFAQFPSELLTCILDPPPAPLKNASSGDSAPETVSGQVVFLGTGTSVGVPAIGCDCQVCTSDDPRNNRTRCSILIRLPKGNLLVDTPPDLRTQLLREKVKLVHAVLFTHEHADHLYGLDDLRLFPFRLGKAVPLYCEACVEKRIRTSFDYAFTDRTPTHPGATPQLDFVRIDGASFNVLGVEVTPIPLKHGPHFDVLGFRIGNFAYCTDTNHIPESSMALLQGLDTLVIDSLRYKPHPTHFSVDEAVQVIEKLQPRQSFLTHISHDLDHGPAESDLPDGIQLAHDGLRVSFPTTALDAPFFTARRS